LLKIDLFLVKMVVLNLKQIHHLSRRFEEQFMMQALAKRLKMIVILLILVFHIVNFGREPFKYELSN